MSVIIIFFNIIVCIFELYMLDNLASYILQKRNNIKIINRIILVGIFVAINGQNNSNLNLICVPLIYIIFLIINFYGNILSKTVVALIYYIAVIIPEFVLAMLDQITSKDTLFSHKEDLFNQIVGIIIMKIITFLIIEILGRILRKGKVVKISNKMFLSLLILPISTVVLLASIFYTDIHVTYEESSVLIIGAILLLFSNVYMFFLYEEFVEKNQKEKELRNLYIKSSLENQYLCHVEKINEKHRLIIHDINKYIRTCIELIAKGEIDKGLALFESIHSKLNSNHQSIYSVNRVLNALLTERVEEAKNKNIKFNINIDPKLNVNFISDIDIISILGNLLDNALEAASKDIQNAFVDFDMYMANENSFLVIEVKNNFLEKPISKGKYFLSTKKDKSNHGLGMYAVEEIITSYDGNIKIDINEKEKEFFVQIILHTFNHKQK